MKGQGCLVYLQQGDGDFEGLFDIILKEGKFTRLDVANDDLIGILNMEKIKRDTEKENFSGLLEPNKSYSNLGDFPGYGVTFGSDNGDVYIRIYDKAAESKLRNTHWIRVEIELKGDRAKEYVIQLLQGVPAGVMYYGTLNTYLRFITPVKGKEKSKCKNRKYWNDFNQHTEKIRLTGTGGKEYTLGKLDRAVNQCRKAAKAYSIIYGIERLIEFVNEADLSGTDYEDLINRVEKDRQWLDGFELEEYSDDVEDYIF